MGRPNTFRKKRRRDKTPNRGCYQLNHTPSKKRPLTEEDERQFEEIRRLKKDVWGRARDEDVNSTPGRLRPLPADPTELEKLTLDKHNSNIGENGIQDYRSFQMPLFMRFLNDFLAQHSRESPACSPAFSQPTIKNNKRKTPPEQGATKGTTHEVQRPEPPGDGQFRGRCFNCDESGHQERDCTLPRRRKF
ncbi:Hypp6620 [Branchiostoma lanceolatum]|uniref:Hypp6620 protein n=1 Tax=Branchiostoma lanceolatum TaxID=7740 RepID=A0A8J9YV50_BRALA|nr:Hypp6620 [Branchiostoma lanceolatum]